MRIKTKLFLLVLIPLVLAIIIQISIFYNINTDSKEYHEFTLDAVKDSQSASDIRYYTGEINKIADQALSEKNLEEIKELFNDYIVLIKKRENKLSELKSSIKKGQEMVIYPSIAKLINELEEEINLCEKLRGDIFDSLIKNNEVDAADVKEAIHVQNNVISKSTILSNYFIDKAEGAALLIKREETKNAGRLYILFVSIIISFILMIFFINDMVIRPIKKFSYAVSKIDKGNLKTRINLNTDDEFKVLSNAFNKSIYKLEKIELLRKRFLSIISHEMRNSITPINLNLELLLEKKLGRLNEEQKESLCIMMNNTNRLNKIVSDLLEISRLENAKLEFNFKQVDIRKLVESAVDSIKSTTKKKIKFSINLKKIPNIKADPERISQVLNNLINNAIKFSKENILISISVSSQNNHLLFSIADNGIGIPKEKQKMIFTPFFQVHDRIKGGMGLGLIICKGIIESQNGKIWFKSNAGKGTTFYFTIPKNPVKNIKSMDLIFT